MQQFNNDPDGMLQWDLRNLHQKTQFHKSKYGLKVQKALSSLIRQNVQETVDVWVTLNRLHENESDFLRIVNSTDDSILARLLSSMGLPGDKNAAIEEYNSSSNRRKQQLSSGIVQAQQQMGNAGAVEQANYDRQTTERRELTALGNQRYDFANEDAIMAARNAYIHASDNQQQQAALQQYESAAEAAGFTIQQWESELTKRFSTTMALGIGAGTAPLWAPKLGAFALRKLLPAAGALFKKAGIVIGATALQALLGELANLFASDDSDDGIMTQQFDSMLQFDLRCVLQKAQGINSEYSKSALNVLSPLATIKNAAINTGLQKGA
jgi:hypothetical protein